MDGKLRVILLVLLVLLFSVRGQDFGFYWTAYTTLRQMYNDEGRITFHTVPNLEYLGINIVQEWVPHIVQDGETKTLQMIPEYPIGIAAAIVEPGNPGPETKHLTRMSISFSKVNYKIRRPNYPEIDMQTHYGVLGLCFNNREMQTGETCVFMLMFSYPYYENQEKYVDNIAFQVNPISAEQLHRIKTGRTFLWTLRSLNAVFSQKTQKAVLYANIPVEEMADLSNLGNYLLQGGSAYYLNPIIVDESILRGYYALLTQ